MKKSDWAAIILIVALVGVASYFIVGAIMPSPADNLQTVPIASEITDAVVDPSAKVFNDQAINPTVKTTIGDQGGQQPFDVGDD